jgi:broad-specificity NMP kinase
MDMIIFLDTNDEVLANRINTRGKWHQMVGQPMETAGDFLQRSRESLKDTVSILCSGNPEIRVLHFNTREKTVDQIIAEVTAVFDQHSASVQ